MIRFDSISSKQMLPNVVEFLSHYPLLGIDDASLGIWKAECEDAWNSLVKDHLTPKEAQSGKPLLTTLLSSYADLARLVAAKQYSTLANWSLDDRRRALERLCASTQVEQRTQQWYMDAANLLTASQFHTILRPTRSRALLVQDKATANVDTSKRTTVQRTIYLNPFTWGIRFEPVVKQIYESLTQSKVREMGRLKHATDTHLAASPDGLVESGPPERLGRFVEFKAPVTREIINRIPEEYMTQMQIQMEVGDVEECDYLEVKFQSLYSQRQELPKQPRPTRNSPVFYGNIAVIQKGDTYRYEYSPLNTVAWKPTLAEEETLLETVPWWTNQWYLTTVGRSRTWFQSVKPDLEAFWRDVAACKAGNFVIPAGKPKKDKVCLIQESSEEETS
jgi:hypothetical protein